MAWSGAPSGGTGPMVLPQGGGAVEVKARRRLKEEGAFEALVNEMETKLAELGNGIPGCTPSVSDLDLSQNHVTPEQLERVLSIVTTHNVFVRRFRLFGIPTFTDDAMRILGDHLRGLTKEQAPTEMHLSDCAITSEGFYHLMSAIEESDLYPGAPPGGKPRPLYLRLENNYISEESLKEKQEAGVVRAFKKSMGQREVTTSSPVKVDIIVHENSSWKQKTGEPPAPENAPPPRMVNDRWDEQQRAKQAMPLAAAAAAAAWGQWQKPQWGGWGGWGGGQQAQKWPAAQPAKPAAGWQAGRPAGHPQGAAPAVRPPPGVAAARPAATGMVRPMVAPQAVRPNGPAAAARPAHSFVPPAAARPAAAAWGAARPAWAAGPAAASPAAVDRSRTPAARAGGAAGGPAAPARPPPKPAEAPLPHPWEEHFSEEYNIPYFWNAETGDSAWERPK